LFDTDCLAYGLFGIYFFVNYISMPQLTVFTQKTGLSWGFQVVSVWANLWECERNTQFVACFRVQVVFWNLGLNVKSLNQRCFRHFSLSFITVRSAFLLNHLPLTPATYSFNNLFVLIIICQEFLIYFLFHVQVDYPYDASIIRLRQILQLNEQDSLWFYFLFKKNKSRFSLHASRGWWKQWLRE